MGFKFIYVNHLASRSSQPGNFSACVQGTCLTQPVESDSRTPPAPCTIVKHPAVYTIKIIPLKKKKGERESYKCIAH